MATETDLPKKAEDVNAKWLKNILSSHFQDIKAIDIKERKGELHGYLGELISIKVHFSGNSTASVIIKVKSQNGSANQFLDCVQFHSREGFFYQQLLPKLKAAAGSSAIDAICPSCHVALYKQDENCSAIVLEDLEVAGYQLADFAKGLDLKQALDAVEALARYHATTYLTIKAAGLDGSVTDSFDSQCNKFLNWRQRHNDMSNWEYFFGCAVDWFEDYYPGEIKLRKKLVNVISAAPEMFKNSGDIPASCPKLIYHGDFWCNNIFFKKEGNANDRIKLIDFQCVSYGSAGNDLTSFIMSSLNADLRHKSTDDILKHYHATFLQAAGDDKLTHSYTFERLMNDYKSSMVGGLCWCLLSVVIFMDNGVSERLFSVIKDLADEHVI